jgi:tetrahydromethanopterin S-methyltransferase subunit G
MNSRDTLKNEITLQTIALSLDNITKTLGNFATKKDLSLAFAEFSKNFATKKDLENLTSVFMRFAAKTETSLTHLEDLIDGLAITTKTELFKMESRLSERIDELDKKVDRNHTYSVNQLDYILTHYARKQEYISIDGRLKKLERKVFA